MIAPVWAYMPWDDMMQVFAEHVVYSCCVTHPDIPGTTDYLFSGSRMLEKMIKQRELR
jgi:hypothetical protein